MISAAIISYRLLADISCTRSKRFFITISFRKRAMPVPGTYYRRHHRDAAATRQMLRAMRRRFVILMTRL